MAVFSNFGTGNHTSLWPFTIIDYWCGAVFIILGLISLVLNPLVFIYYNRRKVSSLWTILYQMLALSDLITLLYYPYMLANEFFKPELSRTLEKIPWYGAIVEFISLNVSAFTASILCATRFVSVKYPFNTIRRWKLVILVFGYTVFCSVILGLRIYIATYQECAPWLTSCPLELVYIAEKTYKYQNYESVLKMAAMATLPLFGLVSLIFSILTVLVLSKSVSNNVRTEQSKARTKKSCLTIIIINFFNIWYCIMVTITMFYVGIYIQQDTYESRPIVAALYFVGMRLFPMILSALNPLVILLRCDELKNSVNKKLNCYWSGVQSGLARIPLARLTYLGSRD